jgi:acetoin utilization protein AcuB
MTNTVDRYMTKSPHTIGQDQTLAAAHRLMREYGIRHLPVLAGGKLVGVLSQRDLHFIETLKDVDPETVAVSEAMSQEVFTIKPSAQVQEVAAEMAEQKYGCAVVVDKGRVAGVFTTVDALLALSRLLAEQVPASAQAVPPV